MRKVSVPFGSPLYAGVLVAALVALLVALLVAVPACGSRVGVPGRGGVAGQGGAPASTRSGGSDSPYRILVFSKTAGFRHDSIPAGVAAIRALGAANHFAVDATEDSGAFTTANLARYRAVVFLNTTGDVFGAGQRAAFESYIEHGGGFVGVHSAADTEHSWPFYGALVGAYFVSHPAVQRAAIHVADGTQPATVGLPATWVRTDEWYNFDVDPRRLTHVLLTLDESSYHGGTMGADHPIAWCHPYRGGRAFYTGGGHTIAAYAEPLFLAHLLGRHQVRGRSGHGGLWRRRGTVGLASPPVTPDGHHAST